MTVMVDLEPVTLCRSGEAAGSFQA